jgi:hypothetical protein
MALEAIAKLTEKVEAYDKCLTVMGSHISKVQFQIDLSMRSIQALQKEHVLLVKYVKTSDAMSTTAMGSTDGVMGIAPPSMIPSTDLVP